MNKLPKRNVVEAAEFCGLPVRTLRNYMRSNLGPATVRPSPRVILFEESDLIEWMDSWQRIPAPRLVRSGEQFGGD